MSNRNRNDVRQVVVPAPVVNVTSTVDNPGQDADTQAVNITVEQQQQQTMNARLGIIIAHLELLTGVTFDDGEVEDVE